MTTLLAQAVERHHQNGFLHHVFAVSPWLGALTVASIVVVGVVFALVKKAGRVLEGTPWYVRLVLLAAAAFGIFRLLNRKPVRRPEE